MTRLEVGDGGRDIFQQYRFEKNTRGLWKDNKCRIVDESDARAVTQHSRS